AEIKYSITGGNVGGLFTIDQRSGTVTLAVALDHELTHQHQLEVTAEAGGAAARAQLVVQVGDVNDNAPEFVRPAPRITVIEEDDRDLPATIARVEVVDADSSDAVGLAFRVSGDGVDQLGDGDAFFTINASTGDLIQLRALDRDPPHGRGEWRLRVEVRDGQGSGEEQEATPVLPHSFSPSHLHRQASWGHQDPERDITPTQAWPQYLRSGDAAIGDTGHGRPADGGRKERQGNNLNEDIAPSRRRDGDVSAVTSQFLRRRGGEDAGAMGGVQYRDRRSFPASYPGVTAAARGSPPSHPSPQTAITAAAGRRERRKQNWKTWSHNLHLHVKDKSESTSQFPLGTKNKSVTGWHDPLAQAARNDHLGTPAHDFQMRNAAALTWKCRHQINHKEILSREVDEESGSYARVPGEARCAVNTAPLSAAANATLSVANGIRQDLSPLSSHTDRHPDPPGAGPTDHRAPHGSLFAGSTKRGSLEARKSSRLKVMEKIPSRHGREDKDASPSEHKASEGQGDAAEERNMPRTLHQTNLESPATTNRIPSSGGVTISKVTRESGQEALTPSPLKGSSCEGVQVLGGVGGGGGGGGGGEGSIVHVVDTVVTVVVKDINDNAPVFPNTTMLGHVQENGPAGEY
ncbi:hypothetical protein O3P69_015655, partial [Scylla paramamosain]